MFLDMAVSTGLIIGIGAAFVIIGILVVAAVVLIVRAIIKENRKDSDSQDNDGQ